MKLWANCQICLVLIVTSLFPNLVSAQSSALRVVTELLEPYQFLDQHNQLGGYSIEVMQTMFRKAGVNYPIEVKSWAAAYSMAKHNKNTLIFSMARTPRREDNFIWGGPLLSEKLYVWGLKGHSNLTIDSLESLKQYQITVIRNGLQHEYLRDNKFTNLHITSNYINTIKLLYGKRTHYIISAVPNIIERTKALQLDVNKLQKVLFLPEASTDLYFGFHKSSDPSLIEPLLSAFDELTQEGEIARLKKKWHLE